MAQHQTWKGGIACKIQGHQEISRKESCLIMFAPFMKHIKPFATCEDNLRKLPFQKWRFTRSGASREPGASWASTFPASSACHKHHSVRRACSRPGRDGWWGYDEDMMRIGKQNHKQNSHKLIQVIDSDEKSYPLDSITLFSERFPRFPNAICQFIEVFKSYAL